MHYFMHVCTLPWVEIICFVTTDFDLLHICGRPCLGPCEIRGIVMSKMEDITYLCAQSSRELILVIDDYLCVPGSGLNRADIDAMISALCTD